MSNQSFQRPLSPHLQIYRLPLTAILSILHRMTGVLLSVGLLVLVIWLVAAAVNPEFYEMLRSWFSTWAGQLILIAWLGSLYFHLCAGLRHLVWDAGFGFNLNMVDLTAALVIILTVLLTAGTWLLVIGI